MLTIFDEIYECILIEQHQNYNWIYIFLFHLLLIIWKCDKSININIRHEKWNYFWTTFHFSKAQWELAIFLTVYCWFHISREKDHVISFWNPTRFWGNNGSWKLVMLLLSYTPCALLRLCVIFKSAEVYHLSTCYLFFIFLWQNFMNAVSLLSNLLASIYIPPKHCRPFLDSIGAHKCIRLDRL